MINLLLKKLSKYLKILSILEGKKEINVESVIVNILKQKGGEG